MLVYDDDIDQDMPINPEEIIDDLGGPTSPIEMVQCTRGSR